MTTNQPRQTVTSQRGDDRSPSPFAKIMRAGLVVAILVLTGFSAWTVACQQSKPVENSANYDPSIPSTEPQLKGAYADVDPSAAVNQLFSSVDPSLAENRYFSQFAKDRLLWIVRQRTAGKLSIILLKNTRNTNLYFEDLMASGIVDGRATIVIAGPRFLDFLQEGGRTLPPFTQRQRNDFVVGLVHETVHLEQDNTANPAIFKERLAEELRAWRKVDLNVVRQLRRLNQPINPRLIEADDALRSCGDQEECQSLRKILLPTEEGR